MTRRCSRFAPTPRGCTDSLSWLGCGTVHCLSSYVGKCATVKICYGNACPSLHKACSMTRLSSHSGTPRHPLALPWHSCPSPPCTLCSHSLRRTPSSNSPVISHSSFFILLPYPSSLPKPTPISILCPRSTKSLHRSPSQTLEFGSFIARSCSHPEPALHAPALPFGTPPQTPALPWSGAVRNPAIPLSLKILQPGFTAKPIWC